MKQVFIIGFGRFGRLALERWRKRHPRTRIWIIDRRPEAFLSCTIDAGDFYRIIDDGPGFLYTFRDALDDDDWIIPALPLHLAWEWLKLALKPFCPKPAFFPLIGGELPFRQKIGHGLYLSYADFLCPDDCPSPAGYCFLTRKKRPTPLWKFLGEQRIYERPIEVVISRQLAPGLGGYPFGELRRIERSAREGRPPLYLATACRCHGVVHGLSWPEEPCPR